MEINLNLLPPERKFKLQKAEHFKKILKLEATLALTFFVFFGVLLSFQYILGFSLSAGQTLGSAKGKDINNDEINQYDEEFKQINETTQQIITIDKDQLYWSNLFLKLSQLVPSGVALDGMITTDYGVKLSGNADNRESLIAFKDSLEKESCFSDINLPLSDLAQKDNAQFEIDFNIQADCLKKK